MSDYCGLAYIIASIDHGNNIPETNEHNNVKYLATAMTCGDGKCGVGRLQSITMWS